MSIMQQQLLSMLRLQDEMNCIVNPDWRNAGYNWPRAIMVEAVEAMEHHGWKWWKKQEPDMAQVRMELVDIWHFILSHEIVSSSPENTKGNLLKEISIRMETVIYDEYYKSARFNMFSHPLLETLQQIAGIAANGKVSLATFFQAMEKSGMTWQDLYVSYIGKNCLNRFRQAHGYKTGHYLKDWSGAALIQPLAEARALEDNDHLTDLINTIDPGAPDLFEKLTHALRGRYTDVQNNEKVQHGKPSPKP